MPKVTPTCHPEEQPKSVDAALGDTDLANEREIHRFAQVPS
ncbi:MAG TPA: hypothetical protein VMW24_02860 [Sedimentisphaerales bacterium]|nr:hypothetical protein [Sedimentisphaerales bacterium]